MTGPPTEVGVPKSKIRIVVADDHPIFRDGLCKLLALEEDFEVVAQAQDGREVLDVLQQYEPDILLLDLKMPGLDGLGTLQRLQAARNRTRVIVLTASDDKNEFVQAMKLGTSGIVLKQTATDLLIKSIRKVHAGEIWLDSKMFISEQTVKNHLHNIFDKLGVSDRLELALYAIHNNLHTGR
jgi:DNA-binding NarL/FixJ family response regulator